MRKFLKCLRQIIFQFDLFPATQLLRYKQEGQFKTLTGAIISVVIIVLFIILFYSLGIQTVNREIINSSITYYNYFGSRALFYLQLICVFIYEAVISSLICVFIYEAVISSQIFIQQQSSMQPPRVQINLKEGSNFMFAIGIPGVNLSDTTMRYFNIALNHLEIDFAAYKANVTDIPLVQCTSAHFSYNKDTLSFYETYKISKMLCPPLDYSFVIGGRMTSLKFQELSVSIDYCDNTIDPFCANESQLIDFQNDNNGFSLFIPIIKTIVNPGDQDYASAYVDDRNFYYFTMDSGLQIRAQIEQYQIDTDVSLMPWSNIQSQFITTIPNLMQTKARPVYGDRYVQVSFMKSSITTIFTRSFNKIDNYLSYVGGLIGTILIISFIIQSYSDKAYFISIASDIYSLSDESPTKEFNFLYFIFVTIKKFLEMCGVKPQWKQSNIFQQAIQQMQKQLSIEFMLKKINFIQEAVNSILNKHQINTLHLNDKKTILAAVTHRSKFNIYKKMERFGKSISKIQNTAIHPNQSLKQNDCSRHSFADIQLLPKQSKVEEVDESQHTQSQQTKKQTYIDIQVLGPCPRIYLNQNSCTINTLQYPCTNFLPSLNKATQALLSKGSDLHSRLRTSPSLLKLRNSKLIIHLRAAQPKLSKNPIQEMSLAAEFFKK